jgi:hypothetical protein
MGPLVIAVPKFISCCSTMLTTLLFVLTAIETRDGLYYMGFSSYGTKCCRNRSEFVARDADKFSGLRLSWSINEGKGFVVERLYEVFNGRRISSFFYAASGS